jgi:hypothetical protein
MYPTALALHRVLGDPSDPRPRSRIGVAWIATVLLIPTLAVAMPQGAQACGNLFFPALLLVFGLGWMLRSDSRRPAEDGDEAPAHTPHHLSRDSVAAAGAVGGVSP